LSFCNFIFLEELRAVGVVPERVKRQSTQKPVNTIKKNGELVCRVVPEHRGWKREETQPKQEKVIQPDKPNRCLA
jgi:hypothetical protein